MSNKRYEIAVLKGDGIGPEVVDEAVGVLQALEQKGGTAFTFKEYACGVPPFLEEGNPLPDATLQGCKEADAVLLGAMGLPDVRWPDGTEIRPQVDLRFKLDLYAGVRPIYLYATEHTPLKGVEAGDIDLVILRENVEGSFAAMGSGIELRGEVAVDSMVITRSGTERIVRYAFELAVERGKEPMKVTCVDKANILRSMAFFRGIYTEVAQDYPQVERDYGYIDAISLYMVQRPQDYDVMVMENMYGDILSDLAAGLVGGLGMAPSADIGEEAAVFQPSHGTAPDIAGQGIANPVGTILSAGLMLRWLGVRHDDEKAREDGRKVEDSVRRVMSVGGVGTPDLGGNLSTRELGQRIVDAIE
jgi:3-isopropylmalate dehydrogenase